MQTCSNCYSSAPDDAQFCPGCQADLRVSSTISITLQKLRDNPHVSMIHLMASDNSCPICASLEGTYSKDRVPILPHPGCSHSNGCRCFYAPILNVIFP